jgi:hypothetical protein
MKTKPLQACLLYTLSCFSFQIFMARQTIAQPPQPNRPNYVMSLLRKKCCAPFCVVRDLQMQYICRISNMIIEYADCRLVH